MCDYVIRKRRRAAWKRQRRRKNLELWQTSWSSAGLLSRNPGKGCCEDNTERTSSTLDTPLSMLGPFSKMCRRPWRPRGGADAHLGRLLQPTGGEGRTATVAAEDVAWLQNVSHVGGRGTGGGGGGGGSEKLLPGRRSGRVTLVLLLTPSGRVFSSRRPTTKCVPWARCTTLGHSGFAWTGLPLSYAGQVSSHLGCRRTAETQTLPIMAGPAEMCATFCPTRRAVCWCFSSFFFLLWHVFLYAPVHARPRRRPTRRVDELVISGRYRMNNARDREGGGAVTSRLIPSPLPFHPSCLLFPLCCCLDGYYATRVRLTSRLK